MRIPCRVPCGILCRIDAREQPAENTPAKLPAGWRCGSGDGALLALSFCLPPAAKEGGGDKRATPQDLVRGGPWRVLSRPAARLPHRTFRNSAAMKAAKARMRASSR